MDDIEIRDVVKRLARPHSSGGDVVERVAILAAGGDYRAIMDWITDHDGRAEEAAPAARGGGLHGGRLTHGAGAPVAAPARYVLPAGALA